MSYDFSHIHIRDNLIIGAETIVVMNVSVRSVLVYTGVYPGFSPGRVIILFLKVFMISSQMYA